MQLISFHNMILQARIAKPKTCERIIHKFEKSGKKWQGKVVDQSGQAVVNGDKVSTELEMGTNGGWEPLFEEFHHGITEAIQVYRQQFPGLQTAGVEWTNYKIKRYDQNEGHFKWHFDTNAEANQNRQLAIVAYLNDVAEGGETAFLHQQVKYKPTAGTALIFPPFWTHLHCGEVPRSGPKYIITSFVEFNYRQESGQRAG